MSDCSTGSATFTTVLSINAMLEPIMVETSIQGASFLTHGEVPGAYLITPSSHGGLKMFPIYRRFVDMDN